MIYIIYMEVSKNGGTQQPWVFLLKMIMLRCFGVPPFKETPILYVYIYAFIYIQHRPPQKTYISLEGFCGKSPGFLGGPKLCC